MFEATITMIPRWRLHQQTARAEEFCCVIVLFTGGRVQRVDILQCWYMCVLATERVALAWMHLANRLQRGISFEPGDDKSEPRATMLWASSFSNGLMTD